MHRVDIVIYRNKCKIYSKLRKEPFAFTVTTMRILLGSSNEPELNRRLKEALLYPKISHNPNFEMNMLSNLFLFTVSLLLRA